jgi:hypothetical protein
MVMSKWISPEQLSRIKKIDLLTYLQTYESNELVRIGVDVYTTREHDSVKISNGKWCRWSPDHASTSGKMPGGKSALDYLIKVRGMDFLEAANYLRDISRVKPPLPTGPSHSPRESKSFALPEPNGNCDRVLNYLAGRGINPALLRACVKSGRLYEDKRNNCVFIGLDGAVPKYAFLRGTIAGSAFKREVAGSQKRFSFSIPCPQAAESVHIFESAIDLLSYMSLEMLEGKSVRDKHYLSLGGVFAASAAPGGSAPPSALEQFLRDHPGIRRIVPCPDNDRAGLQCAELIQKLYDGSYSVEICLPKEKDYNLDLRKRMGIGREPVRDERIR